MIRGFFVVYLARLVTVRLPYVQPLAHNQICRKIESSGKNRIEQYKHQQEGVKYIVGWWKTVQKVKVDDWQQYKGTDDLQYDRQRDVKADTDYRPMGTE